MLAGGSPLQGTISAACDPLTSLGAALQERRLAPRRASCMGARCLVPVRRAGSPYCNDQRKEDSRGHGVPLERLWLLGASWGVAMATVHHEQRGLWTR